MPEWPTDLPRFNHLGFTVPNENLTGDNKMKLTEFFDEVLGWKEIGGGKGFNRLVFDAGRPGFRQFLVLMGNDTPATANPPSDHLGVTVDSESTLNQMFQRCQDFQKRDPRLKIGDMEFSQGDGKIGMQQFFVSYLFAPALEFVCYGPVSAHARPLLTDEQRREKEARFREGG